MKVNIFSMAYSQMFKYFVKFNSRNYNQMFRDESTFILRWKPEILQSFEILLILYFSTC